MSEKIKGNIQYTLVNVLGSLFPTFLLYIAICFKTDKINPFNILSDRGDFLIIAISILISACYTIYLLKKDAGANGSPGAFFWISIFFIVIITFIYALIISEPSLSRGESRFIMYFSIIGIAWCFFIVFVSQYLYTVNPSLPKQRKEQADKLQARYDGLKLKAKKGVS